MKNTLIGAVAVVALLVGGYAALHASTQNGVNGIDGARGPQGIAGPVGPQGARGPAGVNAEPALGGAAGFDFSQLVTFFQGTINRNQVSTSSQATAITVRAVDFRGWSKASVVSYTPNLAGLTITLPASSTIPDVVPRPGDTQTFCIRNATTTASTPVILAGGTGLNLVVASSSATALGGKLLGTGKVGCITLVREALTTTSFDIDALLTVYQ